MNKSLLVLLVISATVNVWLWQRLAAQRAESNALSAKLADAESLRRQAGILEARLRTTNAPNAQINELARLRNEVSSLQQRLKEVKPQTSVQTSWRRLPATADWSEKFASATNELARNQKYLVQLSDQHELLISNLATASPQDLEDLKRRAQSRECMQNLKRIGLAARIWANDHNDKFPADYLTMREELQTPKILFCPAASGVIAISDWSQLNPAAISYTWHGATAVEAKPDSVLTSCQIHDHLGMADGSAQATRPNPGLP